VDCCKTNFSYVVHVFIQYNLNLSISLKLNCIRGSKVGRCKCGPGILCTYVNCSLAIFYIYLNCGPSIFYTYVNYGLGIILYVCLPKYFLLYKYFFFSNFLAFCGLLNVIYVSHWTFFKMSMKFNMFDELNELFNFL